MTDARTIIANHLAAQYGDAGGEMDMGKAADRVIAALSAGGFEIVDRRPIGEQVHEWLSNENNREQIRKMMARFDENFRMNSGATDPGASK